MSVFHKRDHVKKGLCVCVLQSAPFLIVHGVLEFGHIFYFLTRPLLSKTDTSFVFHRLWIVWFSMQLHCTWNDVCLQKTKIQNGSLMKTSRQLKPTMPKQTQTLPKTRTPKMITQMKPKTNCDECQVLENYHQNVHFIYFLIHLKKKVQNMFRCFFGVEWLNQLLFF